MNLSDSISLTPKGVEEALNRTYKINVRLRSVLILLGKPQTFEYILQKQQLFKPEEVLDILYSLINQEFVAVNGATTPHAHPPSSNTTLQLMNGIILSEAKFLLADFCVDSFGTKSQTFVDTISVCKSENNFLLCLKNIYAATQMDCPDRLPVLVKTITEINKTA